MKFERGPVPIDLTLELAEEVLDVASRIASSELRAQFRDEKEAIHTVETVDIRETRLDAFDRRWMNHFGVIDNLESVLVGQPQVEDLVSTFSLRLARTQNDEKAFLYQHDETVPSNDGYKSVLVVQITAETLLDREKLASLVRRALVKAKR